MTAQILIVKIKKNMKFKAQIFLMSIWTILAQLFEFVYYKFLNLALTQVLQDNAITAM